MPAAMVRKLLGDDVIIGVSVNSETDINEVIAEGIADYVGEYLDSLPALLHCNDSMGSAGIGPVLFTASKDKLSPILGPRGIRNILSILGHSPIKSVAIGQSRIRIFRDCLDR